MVEATRVVRYSCAGLLIRAIRCAKEVPESFVVHAVGCLAVNGMTPFALLFGELAKRPTTKKHL